MAGGFQVDAFQSDAFQTTHSMSISAVEQQDAASFAVSATTSISFAASENPDTASFTVGAKTTVAISATENPDTVSLTSAIIGYAQFAAVEADDTAEIVVRSSDKRFLEFEAFEAFSDTASVVVYATVDVSFGLTEEADTAAFGLDAKTKVSVTAVETYPDVASFELGSKTTAHIDATEAPDVAAFGVSSVTLVQLSAVEYDDTASFDLDARTQVWIDALENSDSAGFRAFFFPHFDGDAYVVPVPFENSAVVIPPSQAIAPIAAEATTGYIPDEWQRVDVDQTRGERRKD